MPKGLRIGDIIEIPTAHGLAYAQYCNFNEKYGELLRVLPGFRTVRPINFQEIVAQPHRFVCFFPVEAAVRRKIFSVVAHNEVPEHAREFPVFRAGGYKTKLGGRTPWWLWNGFDKWSVEQLTPDEQRLPNLGIWNDTVLVHRLEQDWEPGDDLKETSDRVADDERPKPEYVRHFVYFQTESAAKLAGDLLAAKGRTVEVRASAYDSAWLTLVSQPPGASSEEVEAERKRLDELAKSMQGEYDGWEMRVSE